MAQSWSKRAFLATVVVVLAATLAAFAYHGYPPPGTDAPSFLVSAINHSLGRGLVNPFYPQLAWSDPTGAQRHLHYPPLFPLVVSWLMPWPTPRGAFLAVALLRCLSLAAAAAALWRVAVLAAGAVGWPETLLIAASLAGMCTSWLPTLGRPEALATLLLLLAALCALHLAGRALWTLLGLLLGLTAATQPVGAVEMALALGLYIAFRWRSREAVRVLGPVWLLAAGAFALVLACGPHGLHATLAGMWRAAPHTPWLAPPGPDWWRPWLVYRRATFYGPLFLVCILCGAHFLARGRWRPAAPLPFAACAALLAACVYFGSLTHKSLRNYNAIMLAPLWYGMAAAWFAWSGRWPGGRARWARAVVFLCVLATGVGFAGYAACLPWHLQHARTLEQARTRWQGLGLPPQPRILMLGNLWALCEDYGRVDLDPRTLDDPRRARPLLVLGQRREYRGRPPEVAGFTLVHDLFNPALAAVGGARRLFVEQDYSFAVYAPR